MLTINKNLFLAALLFTLQINAFTQLQVTAALCENRVNPAGVSLRGIRFSWELNAKENGQYQSAYQLVIASSEDKLSAGNFVVYNSSVVKNHHNVLVRY